MAAQFQNIAQANAASRRARHAYRVAKMVGDMAGMKRADAENAQALNFIRTTR